MCLAGSVFPRSEGAPNDALGDQLQLAEAPMLLNGCVKRSAVSMAGVPTTLKSAWGLACASEGGYLYGQGLARTNDREAA